MSEQAVQFERTQTCAYCGSDIAIPAGATQVTCEFCRRLTVLPHFTQKEREIRDAIDDMNRQVEAARVATDAGAQQRFLALTGQLKAQQTAYESSQARRQKALYDQAVHALQHKRFDEAADCYSRLIREEDSPELHWQRLLCTYGVQYVTGGGESKPTLYHLMYDPIEQDLDYRRTLALAPDDSARAFYRREAETLQSIIEECQHIESQSKPFDVFISVKQADDGVPTKDSKLALNLFYKLRDQGLKVFNSEVSLKEKGIAGSEYAPYILAALHQAKAMVLVCSKREYVEAQWVQDEWRRFRWLLEQDKKAGRTRKLIVYLMDGMSFRDVPGEIGESQCISAGDVDPYRNLCDALEAAGLRLDSGAENPLLTRARLFLKVGQWAQATSFAEQALSGDPMLAAAYMVKLCAERQVHSEEELANCEEPLSGNANYLLALEVADPEKRAAYEGYNKAILARVGDRPAKPQPAPAPKESAPAPTRAPATASASGTDPEALCRQADACRKSDPARAFDLYRQAAEQGYDAAQFSLGLCYDNGEGVAEDKAEAVKWFRKVAEKGDAAAQYNLGLFYTNGEGVAKDMTEAANWYRKAAEQGYAAAQCNLGYCYENGEGVAEDKAEAVKWYRKAAEQGDVNAEYNLGCCYEEGAGVTEDMAEAVKWYRKAADQGHFDAQRTLGDCYRDGNGVRENAEEAIRWYRKAAEQGDANAQFELGKYYDDGVDVPEDKAEAVKWYRLAADQGNADAQYNLAVCYFLGEGVDENLDEALHLYRLSAEQGNKDAQRTLGTCYFTGKGVVQNGAEAVKWLSKAAEQGDDVAMLYTATCYYSGIDIPVNKAEAAKWYRKAAEAGNTGGAYHYGICLHNGEGVQKNVPEGIRWVKKAEEKNYDVKQMQYVIGLDYYMGDGVPKDKKLAQEWIEKAARAGHEDAKEFLKKHVKLGRLW